MDIVSIVLGILIALVAVEAAALVVIMLKMGKINKLKQDLIDLQRILDKEIENQSFIVQQQFNEVYHTISSEDKELDRRITDEKLFIIKEAKSYTDQRFDKTLFTAKSI